MNVAEQLAVIRERIEAQGWKRTNGNTWRKGIYTLHTAYTWGEATLELRHDMQAKDFKDQHRHYRGSEPLTWVNTDAEPVLRKIFAKPLDKLVEAE